MTTVNTALVGRPGTSFGSNSLWRRGSLLEVPQPLQFERTPTPAELQETLFGTILREMEYVEGARGASGGVKRSVVLSGLVAAGIVDEEEAPHAGLAIDLVIWLAHRPEALAVFRAVQSGCGCRQS